MSNNPIKPKDRVKIPRQGMPEQDPKERAHNFQEVNLGLPEELAKTEAKQSQRATVERLPVVDHDGRQGLVELPEKPFLIQIRFFSQDVFGHLFPVGGVVLNGLQRKGRIGGDAAKQLLLGIFRIIHPLELPLQDFTIGRIRLFE